MPDVAGKGALLVNPFSITSMHEGLEKLISDSKLRDTLINEGFENVKRFEVETISAMYYEVYSSLVKRGK
jgi:glycosyltransferase involved in cell wall biosynthesis